MFKNWDASWVNSKRPGLMGSIASGDSSEMSSVVNLGFML